MFLNGLAKTGVKFQLILRRVMVFNWFKKANHAQQIYTNNGQAQNDIIEKEKIKILEGKNSQYPFKQI